MIDIKHKIESFIMNISDKIFVLTIVFSVAWLLISVFQKTLQIDLTVINAIGAVALMLIGAMIGTYTKKGED